MQKLLFITLISFFIFQSCQQPETPVVQPETMQYSKALTLKSPDGKLSLKAEIKANDPATLEQVTADKFQLRALYEAPQSTVSDNEQEPTAEDWGEDRIDVEVHLQKISAAEGVIGYAISELDAGSRGWVDYVAYVGHGITGGGAVKTNDWGHTQYRLAFQNTDFTLWWTMVHHKKLTYKNHSGSKYQYFNYRLRVRRNDHWGSSSVAFFMF